MTRLQRTALLLTLAVVPSVAQAQKPAGTAEWQMPPQYKTIQLNAQETQRKLLLAFADSMPESLYRDKATPIQRDFAQQIHHVAVADVYIASRYVENIEKLPALPDTAATFATRAGLRAFINAAYDYSEKVLTAQTDADRGTLIWYFGQKLPKWQIWDELNQHSLWTIGQVVANFRKHGMAPPAFSYF